MFGLYVNPSEIVAGVNSLRGFIHPDAVVHLMSSAAAKNHCERTVCQILNAEGALPAAELIKRVADEMYYGELRHGAWVADIGIFGPAIFEREAQALLESMVGRCIIIVDKPTSVIQTYSMNKESTENLRT